MNKNYIAIFLAALVAVGGISFYGGIKYQSSKNQQFNFQRNGAADGRLQQRVGRDDNGMAGGGLINGEIIKKDDSSITVKLGGSGSKIVYISDSTSIKKSTQGVKNDLIIGAKVTVSGSAGNDGSMVGQMIQIGPEFNQSMASTTKQQ